MAVPQRPHTRGPTCGLLAAIVAQANHRTQLQQQGQQLFDAREQIATQEHEHEQALARAKVDRRGRNGRLGDATSGDRGLLWLHPKARGGPPHS